MTGKPEKKIELKSISVYRSGFGADKGKLTGTVKFETDFGEITIKPSEKAQLAIIAAMADEIVEHTKDATDRMRASIQEAINPPIEADALELHADGRHTADQEFDDGIPF